VLQWAYNANSGDTGGLVDDTWWNLMWMKLRFLRNHMGLTPWYLRDTSSSPVARWWSAAAAAVNKPKPKGKAKSKATGAAKQGTTRPAAKSRASAARATPKPKKAPSPAHKAATPKKHT
jgi:hypothetical protein